MAKPKYGNALLKLSGEVLAGSRTQGFDPVFLSRMSSEIRSVVGTGVRLGLMVGGGNIARGAVSERNGVDRVSADYMGMLGTVINGLAVQDYLGRAGIKAPLLSAIDIGRITEPATRRTALKYLHTEKVVIFVSGTGNPYFTTDTAAALRAIEMEAQVLLKGTKVDGVYDSDPKKNKKAKRFETLSYIHFLERGLRVMDATAVSLCMENSLPIIVFDVLKEGNLRKAVMGRKIGTLVAS
ncbi:MAG: UMP kinase [bacterium]